MQQRVNRDLRAELDAILAAHMGRELDGDVGGLLGKMAMLATRDTTELQLPDGWQDAVNAALSRAFSASSHTTVQ
jgi:hypothetical protein